MARAVLEYAPMMRLGLIAVTVGALTSAASAGTYVGLGIGSESSGGATRSDGIDAGSMDGYERSGRLMVGSRFSKLSIEGQASRFDVSLGNHGYEATQLAAVLKLSLPLGNNFEFFAKGGLERTWLNSGPTEMDDAAGNGLLLGAGFEYRLNLGVTGASIFVDYQRASSGFENEAMLQWDGVTSMWTLGATVSL